MIQIRKTIGPLTVKVLKNKCEEGTLAVKVFKTSVKRAP